MNCTKIQRSLPKAILSALLCAAMLLTGCSFSVVASEPLSVEEIEDWFEDNQQEILTIVNYLTDKPADDIYIDGPNEEVFSDFDYVTINDPEVKVCVERLWEHGCRSVTKMTNRNAISFKIWSRFVGEAWGGIAFSLDGENLPEEQYCTQLQPLSEDGWFYYVAEYNLWRVQQRESTNTSG